MKSPNYSAVVTIVALLSLLALGGITPAFYKQRNACAAANAELAAARAASAAEESAHEIDLKVSEKTWQTQLIERGLARYNGKTGVWEMIETDEIVMSHLPYLPPIAQASEPLFPAGDPPKTAKRR